MASVDNRIVNMTFNNADFESRISSTIKSLQSLDKTIAEVGTKGGLQNLAAEANKFSLEGMTSAIEGVSAKFLAMTTIGITALANLTNKAIDAGVNIAKALAVEPISQGFSEYELKLGSIQTIMAGSGADLETVNKKLAELNAYSDRTIYSFADMTQNIGKFTNAGVSLDDSVASIQGVANVAAVSGANAEEASRAMYNFAQALSKGHVQLVDWKSIELANMGTVEFKTQLLDAAVAAGTLTKKGEEYVTKQGTAVTSTKNFNDSLQDQWLTTEVLTKTLGDYADETTDIGKKAFAAAQDIKTFSQLMDTTKEAVGSGWAESFEIMFGGLEDAKHLWGALGGAIGDFVNDSADKRNAFLQGWRDLGGQQELFAGLYFAFQNLKDIITPIKDAFREIFPPMTAQRAYELSRAFREFMENLKPSEKTVENIGRIFKGLFNVLDVGWEILKFGVGIIKDFVGEVSGIGKGGALEFLATIGDALASLDAEKIIGGLETAFNKIGDIFRNPIPYILQLVDTVKGALSDLGGFFENPLPAVQGFIDKIGEFFSSLSLKLPDLGGPLGGAVDKIKEIFGGIGEALGGISLPDISLGGIVEKIGGVFSEIIDTITGFFGSGGEMASSVEEAAGGINWELVMAAVGGGLVAGLIAVVNKLINQGINIDFTGGVLSSISETFGQLTGVLKTMQNDIKSNIILKIAAAIGVLALAMIALSFIDAADLAKSLTAIAIGFGQLAGALAILNKINFSTTDAAKFALMALSFGLLAGGMILLAGAMKIFGTMDWEEIAKGEVVLATVVASIIVMSKTIENQAAGMIKASFAMLLMALGMGAMAKSIAKFGEMDTGVLVQGFIGLSAAMALLVATMNLLPDDLEKKTAGLVGFSIALNLMVFAIKQMGNMDLGALIQGGVGFAVMLTGLVVALNMMPANMGPKAGQLIALAAAMLVMSMALKSFSSLGWGEMVQGLVAMGGAILLLVVAMNAASGGIAGAAAMLIMAGAMLMLAAAVRAFAAISFGSFVKGLLMMVGAIAVLAGVAFLLQPALPALLLLGVALAAIGLAVGAVGFGVAQVAKGLAILAKIGPEGAAGITAVLKAVGAGIPALFAGVAEGIGLFVQTLTGMIPIFVEFGVTLLTALLEGLTTMMPTIFAFIEVLITGILGLLEFYIPALVTTGLNILIGLLEGIRSAIPQLVVLIAEIITGMINALATSIPLFIEAGLNLLMAFIDGLILNINFVAEAVTKLIIAFIEAVGNSVGDIVAAGTQVLVDLLSGISNNLHLIIGAVTQVITRFISDIGTMVQQIIDAGTKMLTDLLLGISNNLSLIIATVTSIIVRFIQEVGNAATVIANAGADMLVDFLSGIEDNIHDVAVAVTSVIVAFIEEIGNSASVIVTAGTDTLIAFLQGLADNALKVANAAMDIIIDFINGLATAIETHDDELREAGWNLAMAIADGMTGGLASRAGDVKDKVLGIVGGALNAGLGVLGIGGPSKVFMEMGQGVGDGFAMGIEDNAYKSVESVTDMGTTVMTALERVVQEIYSEMDTMNDFNPVITPILDLTNVQAGSAALHDLIGSSSYTQANNIASSEQYTEDAIVGTGPTEIKFEQTINSPTALSTADIYRQTRNQVSLAKQELSIP